MMRIAAINDFRIRTRAENKLCARHLRSFNLRRRQNRSRAKRHLRKSLFHARNHLIRILRPKNNLGQRHSRPLKSRRKLSGIFHLFKPNDRQYAKFFNLFGSIHGFLLVLRISAAHRRYTP